MLWLRPRGLDESVVGDLYSRVCDRGFDATIYTAPWRQEATMTHMFLVPTAMIATVVVPPPFDQVPTGAGAFLVYGLVIGSLTLVVYYGMKKPKGPRGTGGV